MLDLSTDSWALYQLFTIVAHTSGYRYRKECSHHLDTLCLGAMVMTLCSLLPKKRKEMISGCWWFKSSMGASPKIPQNTDCLRLSSHPEMGVSD